VPTDPSFLKGIDEARKSVKAAGGTQIFSPNTKTAMRVVAQDYFATYRPAALSRGVIHDELLPADAIFKTLSELSHKSPTKTRCDKLLKDGKGLLVKLEASSLGRAPPVHVDNTPSKDDTDIIATLRDICPAAASSYEQGLKDVAGGERLSWRGPATEFREALRETLDQLAPDADVIATPNFKLEQNTTRPTMKQKARFILRSRSMASGQAELLEGAVDAVEDNVSGITRSIYSRSSISTHTPTTQQEVIRIHHWVRLVMCDLLGLAIS